MRIDGVLTEEQEKAGLELVEDDDHTVVIRYSADGVIFEEIGRFYQAGASPEVMRACAQIYVEFLKFKKEAVRN